MMMLAMNCDPSRGRILHAADAKSGKDVLHPQRAGKSSMSQKPMIAEADPTGAKDIEAQGSQSGAGPTEKPGQQRQQRNRVIEGQDAAGNPGDAQRTNALGQRQSRAR